LLNALVCPFKSDVGGQAVFRIRRISFDEAINWLQKNDGVFISSMAHEITARKLTEWSGVYVPHNSRGIDLEPGDEALVIKLERPRRSYSKDDLNKLTPHDYRCYIIVREE